MRPPIRKVREAERNGGGGKNKGNDEEFEVGTRLFKYRSSSHESTLFLRISLFY